MITVSKTTLLKQEIKAEICLINLQIGMDSTSKSSIRLYAIQARNAPLAVVFRRGPSKQVLLTLWHTDTDTFYEGQWLNGRIYERRCDLSPNGQLLIYFAANYKEPYFSWTAISKPPFLTAIALWQKGDGWGGGGLFNSESEILLNHRPNEMTLADGFELPKQIKVNPFGEHSGWGEDSPVADQRLLRDGWDLIQQGKFTEHKIGGPIWIEFNPPQIWSKLNPIKDRNYELHEVTHGLHEHNGSWYVTGHIVVDNNTKEEISLGKTDWADWCSKGELLFAKEGKILRLGFDKNSKLNLLKDAKLLIDLSDRRFEPKEAPPKAQSW